MGWYGGLQEEGVKVAEHDWIRRKNIMSKKTTKENIEKEAAGEPEQDETRKELVQKP